MPWDANAPTAAKYRSREHRNERARLARQLKRDGQLECAQPECIEDTRVILPGMRWAAGHDETGEHYIGAVHKRCNDRDAAKRASARSHREPERPDVASWFA